MSTFLSEEELVELTECSQAAAQMRWLSGRGWPFEVSAKGRPRVLRLVMEKKMGLAAKPERRRGPDFDSLKRAIGE